MTRNLLALLIALTISVASSVTYAQLTVDQAFALSKKGKDGDAKAIKTMKQNAVVSDNYLGR